MGSRPELIDTAARRTQEAWGDRSKWQCARGGPSRESSTRLAGCVAQIDSMPVSREDLVDALARVSQGDRVAFERLYAATSLKLYGVVVRILGRRDLADEVLQEVYARVWQSAGEFEPTTASPITWLTTIARNRALDEAKRKTMRSLDEFPEILEIPSDDNPLAEHERAEDGRRLQACLDRLEPDRKEVVLLAYYYGLTREEIAGRTHRPIATVKTWLRRSLAQLKSCLDQ